jgi:hypothetical protein
MKIQNVSVSNFRSIDQASIALADINVICGPNSSGKSNLFKAIKLALSDDVGVGDYFENIPRWIQSGRTLIRIEIVFTDLPDALKGLARRSKVLRYKFSLSQNGKVTRDFGVEGKSPDEIFEIVQDSLMLTFVPAIRDWSVDGLATFQKVLLNALLKFRGEGTLNDLGARLKRMLENKSPTFLGYQKEAANKLFKADSIQLDTSSLNLGFVSNQISLKIKKGSDEILLDELGTGHQSALIMGLYQQLGESHGKAPVFIFEEPDNHLHPATIRSVIQDLVQLSKKSQVLVSTHSPLVLNHVDFSNIFSLDISEDGKTVIHPLNKLTESISQKDIRIFLEKYGIRATEPLLAKRVVIVEGLTDKTFISKIFELENGRTVDSENCLIIPTGGKDEAVRALKIMGLMGVQKRALFDWDVVSVDHRKHFYAVENEYEKTAMIESMRRVLERLDSTHKRGNNSKKSLQRLLDELESVSSSKKDSYQDSAIYKIAHESEFFSVADRAAIKSAVKSKQPRKLNDLLSKSGAYVLKVDLEEFFVSKADIASATEGYLVKAGKMHSDSSQSNSNRKNQIRNLIHDMAHEPEILEDLIQHVYEKTKFKGTGLMSCINFLFL